MKNSILIIEDEQEIINLLSIHISDLGYEVEYANDGLAGLEMAKKKVYDLIVLDVMLPGMDGLQVCRELRSHQLSTPVLMLTARSEEIDKVLGLEMGADDYLTKPFSVREFIARVKALIRRAGISSTPVTPKDLVLKDLVLSLDKRTLTLKGKKLDLTPKEFDLIQLLAQNPGKKYSRQDLLQQVWGYDFQGYEHTVNSHVNRLRAKVEEDPNNPIYILTAWGIGYYFNDEIE